MAKIVDDYVSVVLGYLQNDKSGQWATLTMDDMIKQFNIQSYYARMVINTIRLHPNVRYRYIPSKSRFKPKEYMYVSDTKIKIDDIIEINFGGDK